MSKYRLHQLFSSRVYPFVFTGLLFATSICSFAADPPKPPVKAPAPAAVHAPSAHPPAAAHTPAPAAGRAGAPAAAGRGASPGATPVAATGRGATPGGAGRGATPNSAGGRSAPVGGTGRSIAGRSGGIGSAGGRGPGHVEQARNGTSFERGRNGQVNTIHHGNMTINRGPGGSFRSERMRPDGSRLVAHRGGGYIEHRYQYGGREVYRRNYYYNGGYYPRYYNPYSYHGLALNVYAPAYYYGPGFYGYAYAPWASPIAYSWGFAGNPWYGYYGGYFTPQPVYASPSLWLTDYLVSQSLQQAYQDRAAAAQAVQGADQQQVASASAPMTPEVKQAIANEVRAQIALENSERQTATQNAMPDPASSGIARMMNDNNPHVFVASAGIVVQSAGQECNITEGDVLQLNPGQSSSGTQAAAVVLASKGTDCSKGSLVSLAYTDLQDMQNHMRETIDLGMGELQKKQGQNGIPAMPPSATAPARRSRLRQSSTRANPRRSRRNRQGVSRGNPS